MFKICIFGGFVVDKSNKTTKKYIKSKSLVIYPVLSGNFF